LTNLKLWWKKRAPFQRQWQSQMCYCR
jgi:hypothetical protein